nr:threonine-phosphate decarboxylase [Litorivivens lipolytica]
MDAQRALKLLTTHGGNKPALCELLGIDEGDLLDLSSAVSHKAYRLPELPQKLLTELPYESAELRNIAADYYGVLPAQVLACAGSQAAIQALPRLRAKSKVLLPEVGYAEHRQCWEAVGHEICFYDGASRDAVSEALTKHQPEVLVLIHPNNPTADIVAAEDLKYWHSLLPSDGQIVVDEAFIDPTPGHSLTSCLHLPGLVILRSVGKFFGLPGLRLGFVLAEPALLRPLREAFGPWPVSSLAQWAGCQMLADRVWQQSMIRELQVQSERQDSLLRATGLSPRSTPLFTSLCLPHEQAENLALALLERGIAPRYYHQHPEWAWLRLGLAPAESMGRLEQALKDIQEGLPRRAI